jgi:SRSO17 transposase
MLTLANVSRRSMQPLRYAVSPSHWEDTALTHNIIDMLDSELKLTYIDQYINTYDFRS